MDQNEQAPENQPQIELEQPKNGWNKTYIILIAFIVVAGITLGAMISRKNTSTTILNTQQTATYSSTPTSIVSATNTPTPTLRPTDPVISGKKQYSNKTDMGITFQYPELWNLKEDLVNHLVTIRNPYNKNEYLSLEKPFDSAGQQEDPLYSESIQVNGVTTTLGVYSYCGPSTLAMKKCNKTYGYVYIYIGYNDILWILTGPDIPTKEGMQDQLKLVKEILTSVRLIR